MRVAFLGLGIPNINETSTMFTDLMLEFHRNGHEVLVVGPTYDDHVVGLQIEKGIQVLRVPTWNLFHVGKIEKGIANLMLPKQYKKALKRSGLNLNYDLIIMPTPPITLIDLAAWFKKNFGSKLYVILRDIFPQNAVDLKMISNGGLVHRYFRKKEERMYALSDTIGCMSQGNIEYVQRKNPRVSLEKMHLMPNWDNLLPLPTATVSKELKTKLGLEDKFIVMFGGNIGKPQKMENIGHLAKACEDYPDIHFIVVGDGYEREPFEQMLTHEKLQNVELMDYMSKTDFFNVLQIADVGLISLSEDFTIPNIPSKALVYFNAKKPILASLDKSTDLGSILEKTKSGIWAKASDIEDLKNKLLFLYDHPKERKKMGTNGYEYMKNNLLLKHAYERAEQALQGIGVSR